MDSRRLLASVVALIVFLVSAPGVWAQAQPPASSSSAAIPFSQIPLRREAPSGGSAAESAGWAVLFLAVVAGAGFLMVRRKTTFGASAGPGWLRATAAQPALKPLGRMSLTQQASVHVVEWQGEELLLACTPQSVTVVARRAASGVAKDAT
jgi:hypothetical protein